MYSELIYTRCGEGVDILRGRNPVKNSGFKVFSCSEGITEDGFTDLPFLYSAAQSKESYADPGFMDDAYLYFVPDFGGRYLLNFHPIHFDRTATGDYAHRPGNFINQIFIGPFDDFYPYELFRNESVWDAQRKGEAFYYENAPTTLPFRSLLGDNVSRISNKEIAAFIADGRREALMNAVAFIVSQYSIAPEKRKYLVIRDENSEKIELWIAAIESAFSPRMASGLSFSTRLDKFINSNKYTVNLEGQYQTQINLQNPNQKLRFKAMIVGVDERDKGNAAAAKALANFPYVLLDGKTKSLSVSVDTANPYYRCITTYNETHHYFCREFMQMVDITAPSEDVLKLYEAYAGLSKYFFEKHLADLLPVIAALKQYRLLKTPTLERLYKEIKQEVPRFLNEDAVSAFAVIDWLESIATLLGEGPVKDAFRDTVCRAYANYVFMQPKSESAKSFHKAIRRSVFARDAMDYLVSKTAVASYANALNGYDPPAWVAFTEFCLDAKENNRGPFPESVKELISKSVYALFLSKNGQSAVRVASMWAAQNQGDTVNLLITDASASDDRNYRAFLIQLICRSAPDAISSEANLSHFYKVLQRYNLSNYYSIVIAYKAKELNQSQDMERFFDWMMSSKEIAGTDLNAAIRALDKNIIVSDRAAGRLACKIQNARQKDIPCINSAHIYALDILDDKRIANGLVPILKNMISQGFPSVEDKVYAEKLAVKLFNTRLPEGAFALIITAASRSDFYCRIITAEAMKYVKARQNPYVGELIDIAARINSKVLSDALVSACAGIKQFDKGMASVRDTITSQAARRYFAQIEKDAKILHEKNKEPSFFGRLFSHGSSDDFRSDKKDKK